MLFPKRDKKGIISPFLHCRLKIHVAPPNLDGQIDIELKVSVNHIHHSIGQYIDSKGPFNGEGEPRPDRFET